MEAIRCTECHAPISAEYYNTPDLIRCPSCSVPIKIDVFPALPGAKDVFVVAQFEPEKNLVLSWRLPNGEYQTTWAFILEQPQPGQTRLLVRGRVASGYRPYGLPEWLAVLLARPAHFIMQRKQLLDIAQRVEAYPAR